MHKKDHRTGCHLCFTALRWWPVAAAAQTYPMQVVRTRALPGPARGTDVMARYFAERLSVPQAPSIDNKPRRRR